MSEVYSLPLDNPFEIPDDIVIDMSKTKFEEDFDDNMTTAMIYLRNIEFKGTLDLSQFDYDKKARLLKLYMLRDIKDLNLRQLDCTIFALIEKFRDVEEIANNTIFSVEESKRFVNDNISLVSELFQMMYSIPIYIMSLDKSDAIDYSYDGIDVIDDMPKTYECMLQLLSYDYANVIMYLDASQFDFPIKLTIYSRMFKYENAELADKVSCSVYSSIYEVLVSGIINGFSQPVLSAQ